MKKILFVCVENSNRSQMAEAFARMSDIKDVVAYSAGSSPSGTVNSKAVASLQELDYDLSTHRSKSLDDVKQFAPFDVVVTMGCGDACPWMPSKKFVDWDIPDPKEMNEVEFRKIREMIQMKVNDLLRTL